MRLDYDGSLRVRVIAGFAVRADDIISDSFDEMTLQAIRLDHEVTARLWLARGYRVRLESRHLDGSLYRVSVLAPAPDEPEGFELIHEEEHP